MQLKTADQVKEEFRAKGIPVSAWAEANCFTRQDVYKVLNGQHKCHLGKAHTIAVMLGLKPDAANQDNYAQTA